MATDIFVGLWARNTETLISDNQGSRLHDLQQAIEATNAGRAAVADRYNFSGPIKSIFVAPEYLFAAEGQSGTSARALSDITRAALKKLLMEVSGRYPGVLIVPGSIIYKQVIKEFPLSYAPKVAKARNTLAEALRQPATNPVDSRISTEEKNRLIREGDLVDKLIKNRMYVLLDGAVRFSYGKHADYQEATGTDTDRGIFIPGAKAGLKSIEGLVFGFEVCFDHQKGVLKQLVGTSELPHVHIISSARVANNPKHMVTRAGGFTLHASSDIEATTVHYKAPPVTRGVTKLAEANLPVGNRRVADNVFEVASATVGGSTLKTFVVRFPG